MLKYIAVFVCIAAVARAEEPCKDPEGNEYEHGANFLATDGCNRCFCSDGLVGCTRMACRPPQVCTVGDDTYQIGESFMDDCNRCVCGRNGVARCTKKACPKVCEHNGIVYQPGDSFQDDCNSCFCGENGTKGCTLMGCPPKVCEYNDETYGVGEAFLATDGCNRCTCQENGMTACTLKACIQ